MALAMAFLSSAMPSDAAAPAAVPPPARVSAEVWPRHIALSNAAVLVYQPQVTGWVDDRIEFRSAAAIRPAGAANETYGVILANARTVVDKVSRRVMLADLEVTKAEFPALPERGAGYTPELQKQLAAGARQVSLVQLAHSLRAGGVKLPTVAVRNAPPRVIVSFASSILVPIDGAPAWRAVAGSAGFERVLNTRALIVRATSGSPMYLHVYDGWLAATAIEGPWRRAQTLPAGLEPLLRKLAGTGTVDLLDGGQQANPKPALAAELPEVHTSQVPAELIVFRGPPDFVPIVGTDLLWAANTTSDVMRVAPAGDYFLLLAGRWFRSPDLAGPWSFVASDALPAGFARIPATSLAGAVLPTVAGTAQAREAAVQNYIPQTATVPLRNGPAFTPVFDGPPGFIDIPGTALAFAQNSPVPIIRSATDGLFAVKAGIWFTAAQPAGPWTVATSVPEAIYTIPPSSPLFFVTFVRIYGKTPTAVHVGYTPGYLGAMNSAGGTVVYGTGYGYASWIGRSWYPAPATYGLAATPVFNPSVGYTYVFAMGLGTSAWTQPYYGGARFHPAYWGAYPCCGSASANVYRSWAAPAKAGVTPSAVSATKMDSTAERAATAGAADAGNVSRGYDMSLVTSQDSAGGGNSPGGSSGAGPNYISANAYYASLGKSGAWKPDAVSDSTYAGPDGNVYRQADTGWQQHGSDGWSNAPAPPPDVNAQAQARTQAQPTAEQVASFSMSNATRFTQNPNDGWSARDSGSGGYSRTLGGDGGISAEAYAYNNAVTNAEWDIAAYGGVCGNGVCVGSAGPWVGVPVGVPGWNGRFGY